MIKNPGETWETGSAKVWIEAEGVWIRTPKGTRLLLTHGEAKELGELLGEVYGFSWIELGFLRRGVA